MFFLSRFNWTKPTAANGVIRTYKLLSVTLLRDTPFTHYEGLQLSVQLTDLLPYSNYTFTLSACTSGGCVNSKSVIGECTYLFISLTWVTVIVSHSPSANFVSISQLD